MENERDHLVILSESETEILTRALAEAAKEKKGPQKGQHTELKKKKKRSAPTLEDTEFFF